MSDSPVEGRVTTEQRGHLLLMGIDRAAKRNAFGPEMLRSLVAAFDRLEDTEEARVGVVFAEGAHFTAGLDLMAMAPVIAAGEVTNPPTSVHPWDLGGRPRTKPVVVAVQGMCLTLGIELILATDVAVAADDARFAQIEVKRAIMPFGGATMRFPQRCGWGNAMRWILSGDEFPAAEALRIGLVQEVVPTGTQKERAIAIAEGIARQAPLAVRATLASARKARDEGPLAAAKELDAELMKLIVSDDAAEGMASFMERRDAKFVGK
ncbi:MAG: crotonase/enoyl-CoA hydratase family protein [Deltaproteobacteria bacterium]|nr:crotonase/enoyl-CoA hydratase family protein [Deltaproteobacteria bacterium]